MKVFLIFGVLCTTFLEGQGGPVLTFTGASSVSVMQPGLQYATFVQHHPLVHFQLQPVQPSFYHQFQFQPLQRPLGFHYPPVFVLQPVQLVPSNGTVTDGQTPGNGTKSMESMEAVVPAQESHDMVDDGPAPAQDSSDKVDDGAVPVAVIPLKKTGELDLDGLEEDGKTRAEVEANEQEDTVAVESAPDNEAEKD